jgi:hypothetical protein
MDSSMIHTLTELINRYAVPSGVLGVAIGKKEVKRKVPPDSPYAVSFFVRGKEPRRGTRRILPSGRQILPPSVEIPTGRVSSDIVDVTAASEGTPPGRMQRARFTAGGPIGNRSELGTFGCLVRRKGDSYTYALTNRHVAIAVDEIVYFPSPSPEAIAAVTREAVGLIADEKFCPLIDSPNAYFDVDAALVQIPEDNRELFAPHLPTLGVPSGIFKPDFTSQETFRDCTVGKRVTSWNWRSRRRDGEISHIWYTTPSAPRQPVVLYSFLIKSTDGMPASMAMDSGKVWVETKGTDVSIVALHQGSIDLDVGARFAVATEMYSLAGLWGLEPAPEVEA